MSSRRSFLRTLSLLPIAPRVLSEVAVEAAVAAPAPELPVKQCYYHYEQKPDPKMLEFMHRYEKAIMAGDINSYGPALTNLINETP
jgi:hypothetical protein